MTRAKAEAQITTFNEKSPAELIRTQHFSKKLEEFERSYPDYILEVHTSRDISTSDKKACCSLVRTNLKALYEKSSWGWSETRKTREMNDEAARFLLVRGKGAQEPPLLGFVSFQVVDEEDEAVIYCYEVQLEANIRGHGIGTRLMELVEILALNQGLCKSMLTAFVANKAATKFYERMGYTVDSSSPQPTLLRGRKVFADYVILSKVLQKVTYELGE